jgi:hypothetical protein
MLVNQLQKDFLLSKIRQQITMATQTQAKCLVGIPAQLDDCTKCKKE